MLFPDPMRGCLTTGADHAADVVAHYNHGHKDRIFLSLAWFIHRRARALMSEQPRKVCSAPAAHDKFFCMTPSLDSTRTHAPQAPLRLNLRTAKRVVGQWTLPQLCANTCAMVDYVLNDEVCVSGIAPGIGPRNLCLIRQLC